MRRKCAKTRGILLCALKKSRLSSFRSRLYTQKNAKNIYKYYCCFQCLCLDSFWCSRFPNIPYLALLASTPCTPHPHTASVSALPKHKLARSSRLRTSYTSSVLTVSVSARSLINFFVRAYLFGIFIVLIL